MKQKVLDQIDDFVQTCYTMFKVNAGNFAKENFPKIVENFWDDTKSDEENLKTVRDVFKSNAALNRISTLGNPEVAKTIDAFCEGWLNKL